MSREGKFLPEVRPRVLPHDGDSAMVSDMPRQGPTQGVIEDAGFQKLAQAQSRLVGKAISSDQLVSSRSEAVQLWRRTV